MLRLLPNGSRSILIDRAHADSNPLRKKKSFMKRRAPVCFVTLLVGALACAPAEILAAELVSRKADVRTVVGYKDTPLLPWTGNKYHVHDPDRPVPKVVVPGPVDSSLAPVPAPLDAIVLFDGENTNQWKASPWEVKEGVLIAGHGPLESKQAFGDCQLHLEFAVPEDPSQEFMSRGNSGVILMGKYELQIFDSWHEHPTQIYPDGQAASIYGQTPPLVNACMPPEHWQSYDIIFIAPVFQDGKLDRPASVTVHHNGVLVHHHQPVMGQMMHRDIKPYAPHPAKLPLVLQGHGSAVAFRNIWIREL